MADWLATVPILLLVLVLPARSFATVVPSATRPHSPAISLSNCTNVTIDSVDFQNVSEGVYALNSSNITVRDARYSNITGHLSGTATTLATSSRSTR